MNVNKIFRIKFSTTSFLLHNRRILFMFTLAITKTPFARGRLSIGITALPESCQSCASGAISFLVLIHKQDTLGLTDKRFEFIRAMWLVALHSSRTPVFDRRTFPDPRSTCSDGWPLTLMSVSRPL